jgi:signal transduction histidine kinase
MSIEIPAKLVAVEEEPHRASLGLASWKSVARIINADSPLSTVIDAVIAEASTLLGDAHIEFVQLNERTDRERTIEQIVDQAGSAHAFGVPIVVYGKMWGGLIAVPFESSQLAEESEELLAEVALLLGDALASMKTRDDYRNLTELLDAQRRVVALVAQGSSPAKVFDAIAVEASRLLSVDAVSLIRYNPDSHTLTKIFASHGPRSAVPDQIPFSLVGDPFGSLITDPSRPIRVDDWSEIRGAIGARHREKGFGQSVGAPIVIDGKPWGYIGAFGEADEILPEGCEVRLADFTQLMATAISSVQLRSLAETQSSLRYVATLVAEGAEPNEVFAAVAAEASRLLGVGAVSVMTYDPSTQMYTKIFGTHGDRACVPDGDRLPLADCPEGILILETGRPVRIDDWTSIPGPIAARHIEMGYGQGIAAPIIIEGLIWGHIGAYGEAGEILPAGSEIQLSDFTYLMASAIANAKVTFELRGLAEKQGAALRRVATLVAQQVPANEIFDAVAREASWALGVQRVEVIRCHEDGSLSLLGTTGLTRELTNRALSLGAEYVARQIVDTGGPTRVDDCSTLPAPYSESAGKDGFRTLVGGAINMEGKLWGAIVVLASKVLPNDTETRLTDFTHLVAGSISNVHARNLLVASRIRIVSASDETRRQIERNLHDGIQQRLVALGLNLQAATFKAAVPDEVRTALDGVAHDLEEVVDEIRVFSHGLHPALLSRSGLGPSLRALARRSPIVVSLEVLVEGRLPESIETAVYYVVSEALANTTKHSQASEVSVSVLSDDVEIRATVTDNGIGGATLEHSSGLIGLVDRVEALGGRLHLDSPTGKGTTLSIVLQHASYALESFPTSVGTGIDEF